MIFRISRHPEKNTPWDHFFDRLLHCTAPEDLLLTGSTKKVKAQMELPTCFRNDYRTFIVIISQITWFLHSCLPQLHAPSHSPIHGTNSSCLLLIYYLLRKFPCLPHSIVQQRVGGRPQILLWLEIVTMKKDKFLVQW